MAKFNNIVIVNSGLDMIAESEKGKPLIFTAVRLGDGQILESDDIKTFTNLKHACLTGNISSHEKIKAGQSALTVVINNQTVETGFFAREIGLYAKAGTNGTEKLYAYSNAGNYSDYLPDKTTPTDEIRLRFNLVTGNAARVEALINGSIVFATIKDVEMKIGEHNQSESAHENQIATQAEAEAGTDNNKRMTPLRVTQLIAKKLDGLSFNQSLHGRLRKSESYSGGVWTIKFSRPMDAESVIVTPELYGDKEATIPVLAILNKTATGCTVKASAPCEGLSWIAVGRSLNDVIKYGAFIYGANSKYGHKE